ncbi:hypothetical protein N7466_000983 [Penicillium verhagenii]|uniref:uncharacterized protein n=1 Tax=Penicillium verhagenii TaxID=1562060 RepID=UPI002544F0B7|nr:uncharacterized protein N7466_000983 [Penicillium verhagenii]KAJ5947968.1 hypothetical protein N7466_000983 [Penicillium verhagenii]
MSFHESAVDIELHDGHILTAKLRDGEGEEKDAEINLNEIIGNDNGHFSWGGENFRDSASGVELSIEGEGIPVLRAVLTDLEGMEIEANVNLAERISNNNGELVFV